MPKYSILIVDDEVQDMEMAKEYLANDGYEIVLANSYDEAVIKIREKEFDIAVIDLYLTKFSSNATGLRLINQEIRNRFPVIVWTKNPTPETAKKSLMASLDGKPPAVDYVNKAEGLQKLSDAIQNVLKEVGRKKNLSKILPHIFVSLFALILVVILFLIGGNIQNNLFIGIGVGVVANIITFYLLRLKNVK